MSYIDLTLWGSIAVTTALAVLMLVICVLSVVIGRLIWANNQLASEILVFKAYEKGGPPMVAGVLGAQKLAGVAAQLKQEKAPVQEKPREYPPKSGLVIDQKFH